MPGCAGALGSEHHGGVAEGVHGIRWWRRRRRKI